MGCEVKTSPKNDRVALLEPFHSSFRESRGGQNELAVHFRGCNDEQIYTGDHEG